MVATNLWWKKILDILRLPWLATVLFIPLAIAVVVLGLQVRIARQDVREARIQAINIDRISKVQESGKALDAALAGYLQSTAELGLAEREVRVPGSYRNLPVSKAQANLVLSRVEAEKALARHAGDIQGLRGTFDQGAADRYMTELANINSLVDGEADINKTAANITALGKLVGARNAMIDQAISKVG